MWGFFKGLFGGSDNVGSIAEKAADGIYNGIDKLVYTDEEKAEAMAEGRKLFLTFIDKAYDQNSTRSVTRRWLAFIVVGPTMVMYIMAALAHGAGLLGGDYLIVGELSALMEQKDWVNPWVTYSTFLFKMAQVLTPWAGGVLVFYFGPHLMGAIPRKSG